MKKILIFISLIFFGSCFFALGSQALTVSPAKVEFSADPGDTIQGKITLINSEGRTMTYYSSFERVETRGTWGDPVFTGERTGLASWIETSPSEVTLEPGQQSRTSFTIRIPENADPGGHYAAIFWGTSPPKGEGGGIGIASRIAILVLLGISGDVIEAGEIIDFQANKKIFNYLPVTFSYLLKNTGTVHLKPEGQVIIKNILGKTSTILLVNPKGYNALPGAERDFSVVWEARNSSAKLGGFLAELKKEKSGFSLGYYKATLDIEFGKEKKTSQASFSFWILPWRILLLSFLILGGVFFIFSRIINRYNRWIINKAREGISPKKIPRKTLTRKRGNNKKKKDRK